MGNSKRIHSVVPVFIGGTGRSGTTVLGDLLNEHSKVRTSNPTEIKFLANRGGFLDVVFGSMNSQLENREKISIFHYRTYRQRAQKDLLLRRERFEEFSEKLWQKWWQIDAPAPHGPGLHAGIEKNDLQEILNDYSRSIKKNPVKQAREFMVSFMDAQKSHKGEKYWAETTPMNISYSHRLIKLFPEAKFIVIRRDPRDVIASLLTKEWGPNSPLEGVEWIESRLRADHEALKSVPHNQVLFINLEDLVTNSPQESYNQILSFLQLQDEPAMRTFHTVNMTAENASSGRWRKEIDSPEFCAAIDAMNLRLQKDSII
jgi:hypothetical protein